MEKQITRRVSVVLGTREAFRHAMLTKGQVFDDNIISPLYAALRSEVERQSHKLISEAKVLPKPRNAKTILADLAKTERLTPELLDEIRRSQKNS